MSASQSRLAWPVIWINGFPGTGKHTIAKLFATLLADGDPLLIDNQSLIDPVEANFSLEHPNYQQERRRRIQAVFKSFVEDSAFRTRIVIFTDFQSNNDLGRDVAREYEAAALRARPPFLPVYLECDIKENKQMRSRCQLFRFDGVKGITSDVTNMGAEEAAEALAREVTTIISNVV